MTKAAGQGGISKIEIRVRGNVEGRARLTLWLDGKPYKTRDMAGETDFSWNGDWYADDAELLYEPIGVTSGSISLAYRFLD